MRMVCSQEEIYVKTDPNDPGKVTRFQHASAAAAKTRRFNRIKLMAPLMEAMIPEAKQWLIRNDKPSGHDPDTELARRWLQTLPKSMVQSAIHAAERERVSEFRRSRQARAPTPMASRESSPSSSSSSEELAEQESILKSEAKTKGAALSDTEICTAASQLDRKVPVEEDVIVAQQLASPTVTRGSDVKILEGKEVDQARAAAEATSEKRAERKRKRRVSNVALGNVRLVYSDFVRRVVHRTPPKPVRFARPPQGIPELAGNFHMNLNTPDGNCLFNTIASYIDGGNERYHRALRGLAIRHVLNNFQRFWQVMDYGEFPPELGADVAESESVWQQRMQNYLDRMGREREWGHLLVEGQALSEILGVRIRSWSPQLAPGELSQGHYIDSALNEYGDFDANSGARLHIAHVDMNHFNLLVPVVPSAEDTAAQERAAARFNEALEEWSNETLGA